MSWTDSVARLAWIYVIALAVGTLVAVLLGDWPSLTRLLLADLAATAVVFAASVLHDNTSCYDPYWSVAPLPIAVWWVALSDGDPARHALILAGVALWGARLTWNFLRGWTGFPHEDWRYVAYRQHGPLAYWGISLTGLHAMPTLLVFGGLLTVWAAVDSTRPLGLLDALGAVVLVASVVLCEVADRQLKAFREGERQPGDLLDTGVWARVRNPNYLGEIGFWWGLWIIALGADWANAWTAVGPLAITLLFVFISIPLKERRMAQRRGERWTRYVQRTPALLPGVW